MKPERVEQLRKLATRGYSPAGFAAIVSDGKWKLSRHLDVLNRKLLDLATGRIKRLMVMMPPRHGKSELCSKYFPAWYLGTFPDRRVILTSYSANLADKFGWQARELIEGFGQELFGVKVSDSSKAQDWWWIDGRQGYMTTAGVGGSITGKGSDVFIVDDPIKDAEQAASKLIRDKQKEWWKSTASTRAMDEDSSFLIIQTRWHEDDLSGWLLSESDDWDVLKLPALAEDGDPLGRLPGEPLWPERWGLEYLEGIRKEKGAYWFGSLYQQNPIPDGGNIFRKDTFRYFEIVNGMYRFAGRAYPIDDTPCYGMVDLAISQKTTADYTVICVYAVTADGDILVLDVIRDRMDSARIKQCIKEQYHKHGMDYIGIEKVGFQEALIQDIRNEGCAVRPQKPKGDKVSRAHAASVRFDGGKVFFRKGADWLDALEHELLVFPNGQHDDQVDALSYACLDVGRRHTLEPQPEPATVDEMDAWNQAKREFELEQREQWVPANAVDDDYYWQDVG